MFRLFFRSVVKSETEKERLLLAFQINEEIVYGRFPVTRELALELGALLAQVRCYIFMYNIERLITEYYYQKLRSMAINALILLFTINICLSPFNTS